MARVPTESEIKDTQNASKEAEDQKRAEQQAEGKDFVNNRQGVLPEEVWQNLPGRSIKDPEATE